MTRQLRDVYIVDAVRTPVGKYGAPCPGCAPTTSPPECCDPC